MRSSRSRPAKLEQQIDRAMKLQMVFETRGPTTYGSRGLSIFFDTTNLQGLAFCAELQHHSKPAANLQEPCLYLIAQRGPPGYGLENSASMPPPPQHPP